MHIPSEEQLRETVNGFENFWGFPQVIGAIDGSHVPIIKPKECASDYSITIQGVDLLIGWPGKVHVCKSFFQLIMLSDS